MCFLNFIWTVLVPLTQLQITCVFPQNSFQRISVIFSLLIPDVIKLVRFLILYNRTNSLVLFVFTGVTFGVFDIIYFPLALKHLDINRVLWWMCHKNKLRTKVLSLNSSKKKRNTKLFSQDLKVETKIPSTFF